MKSNRTAPVSGESFPGRQTPEPGFSDSRTVSYFGWIPVTFDRLGPRIGNAMAYFEIPDSVRILVSNSSTVRNLLFLHGEALDPQDDARRWGISESMKGFFVFVAKELKKAGDRQFLHPEQHFRVNGISFVCRMEEDLLLFELTDDGGFWPDGIPDEEDTDSFFRLDFKKGPDGGK